MSAFAEPSPNHSALPEPIDSFIRQYVAYGIQQVDEFKRQGVLSSNILDNHLGNLSILSGNPQIAYEMQDDTRKALALATLGFNLQDQELVAQAVSVAKHIEIQDEQDIALGNVALVAKEPAVMDEMTDQGLRRRFIKELAITTGDLALLDEFPTNYRDQLIELMADRHGDASLLEDLSDMTPGDRKIAIFAEQHRDVTAVWRIQDPAIKAATLLRLVKLSPPLEIPVSAVPDTIARIEAPYAQAAMYIQGFEQLGDRALLEGLQSVVAELDGTEKLYAESAVALFTGDEALARGMLPDVRQLRAGSNGVPAEQLDQIRANLALTLRDYQLALSIENQVARRQALSDVLLSIGDVQLAIEKDNFKIASQLAIEHGDVDAAWQIAHKWHKDKSVDAYGPLVSVASKIRDIEPLLRDTDVSLQKIIIYKYVLATGDISKIGIDGPLIDRISLAHIAHKQRNMFLAEEIGDKSLAISIGDALLHDEKGLLLEEIHTLEDPIFRLTMYNNYTHDWNGLPPDDTEARLIAEDVEAIISEATPGMRYEPLAFFGRRLGSVSLLQAAATDILHAPEGEESFLGLIGILHSLKNLAGRGSSRLKA